MKIMPGKGRKEYLKQYMRIFRKKLDNDKYRFWASISTESSDKEGDYITANIPVNMSKEAREVFDSCSRKAKTKGIRHARLEVLDSWLKAALFGKEEVVVLFVNKAAPAETDEDNEDD